MSNSTTDPSSPNFDTSQCALLPPEQAIMYSLYGYVPSETVCIIVIVLFAISTALHAGEAVHKRTYWLFPTAVLAGMVELIGWFGRLWSSQNVCEDGYYVQIVALIIAPTPLLAANFMILSRVISALGPEYSRLSPKLYSRIFLSCDLLALVVQSAGGGLAASSTAQADIDLGGNIMLGGVSFQLCAITVFAAVSSEFVYRFCKGKPLHAITPEAAPGPLSVPISTFAGVEFEMKGAYSPVAPRDSDGEPDAARKLVEPVAAPAPAPASGFGGIPKKLRLALLGLALSTALIFVRSIYRVIELADGFSGPIITTEIYFNFFDGGMIIAAMVLLNVLHPGWLLPHDGH